MEEIEPSTEMKSYQKLIKYIKKEGIEGRIHHFLLYKKLSIFSAIIGSFLKLFCSILLVKGARMVNWNVVLLFSKIY